VNMRTTLICRLHENQQQMTWALFDTKQNYIDSGTQLVTQPLPQPPQVILLPTTAFLVTQMSIPSKKKQKIIQAVPYLLEEQLIDEVENLHFVLGERDTETHLLTVAVIAQQQLQKYLEILQPINLKSVICTLDIFAVPKPIEGWGLLLLENCVLIRTQNSGFAIESHCLSLILQSIAQLPSQITVFGNAAKIDNSVMTELYGLGIPIIEENQPQDEVEWWQRGLKSSKLINVLQGLYRPVNQAVIVWRPWRLTVFLLLILIIVTITTQIITLQQLENQRQQLNHQIETLYQNTFPEARKIVNPKAQMEQQLAALRLKTVSYHKKNDFLTLLTQFSPFLSQLPNLQLKRIDYLNTYFDISLATTHLQALDQLKQSLQVINLQLEIKTVTSHNNKVEAQLRISQP